MQDYPTFFRLLLAFSYAAPRELGYDSTISLFHEEDGLARYDITVRSESGHEKIYRTLDILADTTKQRLIGRGTRVWTAVRVLGSKEVGEPVALKDS